MPSVVVRRSLVKPKGPIIAEPQAVGHPVQFTLEMVPRNCRLEQYDAIKVLSFKVDGEVIAYCSPDSTYAVTKRLFDQAKKSIVIGIYDFSAEYMKELVLNALRRHVKIKLMLDIDSKDEQALFTCSSI